MKVFCACSDCLKEEIRDGSNKPQDWFPTIDQAYLELNDKFVYRFECSKGHTTNVALDVLRHELLFEIGAIAHLDGYPDAAILRGYTSLERYFEFIVAASILVVSSDPAAFELLWSHMQKSSERQFGAYALACSLSYCRRGKVIHKPKHFDALSKTRNDVIHRGYIPSESEALDFLNEIYSFIVEDKALLSEDLKDGMNRAHHYFFTKAIKSIPMKDQSLSLSTSSIPTALSRASNNETLSTYLQGLRSRRFIIAERAEK